MKSESGWLVLGRKAQEEICIGDDIRIKIVSTNGTNIRVAIKAEGLKVLRGELFDRLQAQQKGTEQ
jgi:carbon storage regulator CsrA